MKSALICSLLVWVSIASAKEIWVNNQSTNATNCGSVAAACPDLKSALVNAVSGDTITIVPGNYSGPGNTDLVINDMNITIQGDPTSYGVRFFGNYNSTWLSTNGSVVIINNLDLWNFSSPAMNFAYTIATLNLTDVENTVFNVSGAAVTLTFSNLTMTDSRIELTKNTFALFAFESFVNCSGCTFRGNVYNTDEGTGGIKLKFSHLEGYRMFFFYNSGDWGADLRVHQSSAHITYSLFDESSSATRGGSIMGAQNLILENCVFQRQKTFTAEGGSIYWLSGNLTIINSQFETSTAGTNGGSLYLNGPSNVNIINSVFDTNTATAKGGAIYSEGANVTLNEVIIRNNLAVQGAGIFVDNSSNFLITESLITSNTATEKAGGIFCNGSSQVTIEKNVTFSENKDSLGPSDWICNGCSLTGGENSWRISCLGARGLPAWGWVLVSLFLALVVILLVVSIVACVIFKRKKKII